VTRPKIAVIGSGVSGITAGYVLSHTDYVTLFEAGSRLGGHADTHMVVPPAGPPIGVDTGFIVYNERTYPLLSRMFAERSCPPGTALSYPASYLFAFLANHGMLAVTGSPPWRTVTGGSRSYVERAAKRLHEVRLCTPVRAVRRHRDGAEVRDAAGETHQFDAVVIATHPDQALRLLDPPAQAERDVLGAFGYTRNPAMLHTDVTLLPDRPGIRASWNYELGGCQPGAALPRISYHMNRLQNLPAGEEYIVTLGGQGVVDPAQIIDQMDYAHPAYTPASVAAQRRLPELNTEVTAFAGAYHGWGFHEDGCRSGAEAARALGGTW